MAAARDAARSLDSEEQPRVIEKANQRINKKYCLLEKEFINDPYKRVSEVLSDVSSVLKIPLRIVRFVRWETGET